ncbi:hypothetical protein CR513_48959, partial [Mucuna pruriens]
MVMELYDFENNRNYMFYSSTHEIWENHIETYSIKEDSATCYDIERKIFNSRQGTLSVTKYYRTLNGLWIELDQYQGLKMCKADSVAYARLVERVKKPDDVMLDKGNSHIGYAMVTRKCPTKRSTSKKTPFTKSDRGEYYTYCK